MKIRFGALATLIGGTFVVAAQAATLANLKPNQMEFWGMVVSAEFTAIWGFFVRTYHGQTVQ